MSLDPSLAREIDVPVARFGYNPSGWGQRGPICIAAAVGAVIALYMALYQWRLIDDVWDPVFGDQTKHVLDSDVSHWMKSQFRVPDAAFGALAYIVDVILGLAGSTRRWQYRPWVVILFGIAVIPLGIVSATLIALQGTVVGAWCYPCIVTAGISLLLVYWAYDEVWMTLLYLAGVWKETRSFATTCGAAFGQASEVAEQVAQRLITQTSWSS